MLIDKNDTSTATDAQAAKDSPQAQAATSNAQAATETPNVTTTDELLRQLSEVKREAQGLRKRFRDQEEASQAAEQQRLKEQGEFKQLAEKHEARVKELEPVSERYSQLSALVASQIEAQVKSWPPEIKVFDPGADAPIEQRLAWIEKSKPLIDKLALQARATSPGMSPNPRPVATTQEDATNAFMKQLRASGKYGA